MNIEDDPDFIAWKADVVTNLIPKLEDSAVVASIVPDGPADAKFAVELGLSIMMDKPIILVTRPGTRIPAKLALVADDIVEIDFSDPERAQTSIGDAIYRLLRKEGA